MLNIQIRPIKEWPGKQTSNPATSPFRSGYSKTLQLLEFELQSCQARLSSLVLEMFVEPGMIRKDGKLYADARVQKPGVIFRFTRETNLRQDPKDPSRLICDPQQVAYPCDAFNAWTDNLRAIALSMESLRRVERYGVFKYDEIISRLCLPSAEGKALTRESAAAFIAEHSGVAMQEILFSETARATAYRKAAQALHPDRGGNVDQFVTLTEANNVLSAAA